MTEPSETSQTAQPVAPESPPVQDEAGASASVAAPVVNGGSEVRPDAPPPPREDRRLRLIVRYGLLSAVGEFTCSPNLPIGNGDKLVIQTDRGIEIGEHVLLTPPCGGEQTINPESIRRYIEQSGQEYLVSHAGRILRRATEQDLAEWLRIKEDAGEELAFCREAVRQHDLPMRLIACEHLFGGERVVFYFMAEGRVDFRELVRDLARQYQTRIEMFQVGARDEARLLADYEICGRECCCKNFLKTLRPVSMKMAKMQKATLDPSKVSGRCGRLRCCLRYEHETYSELNRNLPRMGAWVRTSQGDGKVFDRHIISQLVAVQFSDMRIISFPVEEITVLADKAPVPSQESDDSGRPSPERGGGEGSTSRRDRPVRRRRGRSEQVSAPVSQDGPIEEEDTSPPDDDDTSVQEVLPSEADESPVEEGDQEESGEVPPAAASERSESGPSPRRSRGRRRRRRGRKGGGSGGGESSQGRSPDGPVRS